MDILVNLPLNIVTDRTRPVLIEAPLMVKVSVLFEANKASRQEAVLRRF